MVEMSDNVASLRKEVLEESEKCEQRWSKVPQFMAECGINLNDISDKYLRMSIAVLLENQRLMKEHSTNCDNEPDTNFWKKSYSLVVDVYANALFTKLCSIQPMIGPQGWAYYIDGSVQVQQLSARTRRLRSVKFNPLEIPADIAVKIREEMDWETYCDLWNNVGTKITLKEADIRQALMLLASAMEKKGHKPNWMVVTPKFLESHPEVANFLPMHVVNPVEMDATIEGEGVLLGHKGDEYMDSGYIVAPYVPFTKTPVVLHPDTFSPFVGVITRYDKKLVPKGSNYYGKVVVQ